MSTNNGRIESKENEQRRNYKAASVPGHLVHYSREAVLGQPMDKSSTRQQNDIHGSDVKLRFGSQDKRDDSS